MLKLATYESLPQGYTGTIQWYVVKGLLPDLDCVLSDKTEYLIGKVHSTKRYAIDRSNIEHPYLGMQKYSYYLLGYGIVKTSNIVVVT